MASRSIGSTPLVRRALLLVSMLGVATCGDGSTGPDVAAITISPRAGLAVGVGGTETFAVRGLDRDGNTTFPTGATWTSADTRIATINAAGHATAVSEGTTEITVSVAGVSETATLEVYVPGVVTNYVPGTSYWGRNDYIEYIPGDLPVVLSAPHGGSETPMEIATRTFGVTGTDRNTLELTLAVRDALIGLGGLGPHVIVSHLHRGKLDPNREIVEAAQGDAFAEHAWEEFQAYIERARSVVERDFGGGMYFDMHGHGHDKNRLELGYLLSSTDLNGPDVTLNSLATVQMTSIREIGRTTPLPFAEVLRGPTSLGGLLEDRGVPALPSPGDPFPNDDPYFTGGYNTRRHGSLQDTELVSGIQIEHHYPGLRDSDENRRAYATLLAEAIREYMLTHLGFFEPTP